MRARRLRTWILRPTLAGLLIAGGWVGWVLLISDNFGIVAPGSIYRSGQMGGGSLARRLGDQGIRTVLNLRGSHPESAWYRDERAATLGAGATQVDIPLSSCEWMSRAQARALVEVLETAERPLLVHCFHGSERTGLAAAFAELLRPGATLDDAEAQFTARHLYFGFGDGVVTRRHLEQYEGWLRDQSLRHAPDQFRRWIAEGYRPGRPSREQWDFDPYPLVVVTRGLKRVAGLGGDRR
jgi:protein tyrosine phosphatase (PTP) superfamily phosphohydrolase (DUF442 family)